MANVKIEIKEGTNYHEFSEKVAEVIVKEYGTHLIKPILLSIQSNLFDKITDDN